MIDPRTVCVAIPCYSGRNICELTGAIWTWQGLFSALSLKPGCSHPSLVRNLIAAQFLDSPFEWLVCVDDDIYPTRQDMELLLQPIDYDATYYDHENGTPGDPIPTRIEIPLVVDGQRDLNNKVVAQADVLVNAEYCYKDDELRPVKFGMGFTRIHRSVFRTLEALKHPDNPQWKYLDRAADDLQVMADRTERNSDQERELLRIMQVIRENLPDPGGGPRLWQCMHKGKLCTDFFPSGPILSQFVPTAEWKGEDHGFFTLCHIAGIVPRIETRTRLTHVGTKGFHYEGPDTGLAI